MKEDLFRGEKEFTLDQAVSEANRCLLCYDPPCSKGCPAGTDPGRFIRKLRLRNITGAIRTIKQNNILGGSCAGLCPTHKLCEKECSATKLDRPIQIGKIQRFLIDYADKIGFEAFDKPKSQRDKVAVVGAGPAGLSCAATLAKEGIHVTLFEKRAKVGGVLRYGVPAYRLEESLLDRDLKDLEKLGVSLKTSSSISGKNGAEQLLSDGYKAVFLATGLVEPVRLIQNSAEGVFTWTDFLSKLKDGRSGEVIPYIKDKVVAVIGGGSVAIDCAESALKFGASDV
ncbi:MAG: FAD-dependent oxidoreductase, partial [Pseudomonadota bacterium]